MATKKITSLFKIKDNIKRLSCVLYQGICSCGNKDIGKTMRHATTRIDEHEQQKDKLETSKHLKNNPGQKFDWMMLSRAPLQRFLKVSWSLFYQAVKSFH